MDNVVSRYNNVNRPLLAGVAPASVADDDCRLLSDSDNVALEGSPFGPVTTSAHYSSRERTRTYLATSNLAWRHAID